MRAFALTDKTTQGPSGVAPPSPPIITGQPANRTVTEGETATFSVTYTSAVLVSIQWRRNGVAVAGATSASYSKVTSTADNGAVYSVAITNAGGTTVSSNATLTVNALPVSGRWPLPEMGDDWAGLILPSEPWANSNGYVVAYRGSNGDPVYSDISRVNNSTGLLLPNGTPVFRRVTDGLDPAKSAFQFRFHTSTSNVMETTAGNGNVERSQMQWSVGTGGITSRKVSKWGGVEWFFASGYFVLPRPAVTQFLWLQHHANKKNLADAQGPKSWGAWSPPWALYIASDGSGGNRMIFNLRHTTIDRREYNAQSSAALTYNNYTDIIGGTAGGELQNNTLYTIITQRKMIGDSTGWIKVWVNGSLKINLTGVATTYPHDSRELYADGSWKPSYEPFNTVSFYNYTDTNNAVFEQNYYGRAVGYRLDDGDITEPLLRAKLESLTAYNP